MLVVTLACPTSETTCICSVKLVRAVRNTDGEDISTGLVLLGEVLQKEDEENISRLIHKSTFQNKTYLKYYQYILVCITSCKLILKVFMNAVLELANTSFLTSAINA